MPLYDTQYHPVWVLTQKDMSGIFSGVFSSKETALEFLDIFCLNRELCIESVEDSPDHIRITEPTIAATWHLFSCNLDELLDIIKQPKFSGIDG